MAQTVVLGSLLKESAPTTGAQNEQTIDVPDQQVVRPSVREHALFLRRVVFILSVQTALTVMVAYAVGTSSNAMAWYEGHKWVVWLLFPFEVICLLVFFFCRKLVAVYTALLVFTLSIGLTVGFACGEVPREIVLDAAYLTVLFVVVLTVYAFTGASMSSLQPYVCVGFVYLSFGSLACIFVPALQHFIAFFGVLISGFALIVDIQWTIEGKYEEFQNAPVIAAVNIYLDIVNLFLYLLSFLQSEN